MPKNLEDIPMAPYAPLELVQELLNEFRKEEPEKFQEMIDYAGSDGDVIRHFRVCFVTFILSKLGEGKPFRVDECDEKRIAIQIGGSMKEVAKFVYPEISFNRVEES